MIGNNAVQLRQTSLNVEMKQSLVLHQKEAPECRCSGGGAISANFADGNVKDSTIYQCRYNINNRETNS